MKINELKYPRDIIKKNEYRKIYSFLKMLGFIKIGSPLAAYANVFSHPKLSYILKIFKSTDHCYRSFYDLVQTHPNPHFPKFIGKMMRINDDYYAIRMEKLAENSSLRIKMGDGDEDIYGNDLKHFIRHRCINRNSTFFPEIVKAYPRLEQACTLLIDERDKTPCKSDFHGGNILFRGNIPVIIDPWAP